ncbi:MAG: hypothetical protein AABN33_25960 [Acidobacteriota bacterium]
MSDKMDLDEVRKEALERIDRSERNFRLAFYAAAVFEALFLLAFVLAADFSNRLHVLLFIATVGSYSVVVLGLVTLGAYMNRGILRVLTAIELIGKR